MTPPHTNITVATMRLRNGMGTRLSNNKKKKTDTPPDMIITLDTPGHGNYQSLTPMILCARK